MSIYRVFTKLTLALVILPVGFGAVALADDVPKSTAPSMDLPPPTETAPAPAPPPPATTASGSKTKTSAPKGSNVLDFEADVIEGERSGPSILVQMDLQAPNLDTLVFQRKNFNDFHSIDMKRKPKYRGQ